MSEIRSGLYLFLSHRVVNKIPSYSMRLAFYRRIARFSIGEGASVLLDVIFTNRGNMRIGKHSVINQGCRIDNRGGVTIGENVSVSWEACVLTADHDPQSETFAARVKEVVIEDWAFIGTRAMILPGVVIGRGAVVAACSVVTRSVPPFTIVAGNPAREIGRRRPDLKYTLNFFPPFG